MSEARESIGSKIIVGIVIAVVASTIGYFISYLDARRKDQITYVNSQVERLYGPLFSLIQANNIAWNHFQQGYWPHRQQYFQAGVTLSSDDIELWRRWMRNVFQPINIKMEDAIVNNAQLLVGEKMPPMFLQFISHSEAYKAVIAKWKEGSLANSEEFSARANVSPVSFPAQPDFTDCIVAQYHRLKSIQQKLQEQFVGWFTSLTEEPVKECRARKS
ncbi:hypothetical protein [Methylobacterium sp. SyP6R]|uniref:hypothetical protein n=1 Tax=Methylobacterium sp. SyP6R TaxID=2718876 RepID=UPI001F390A55|nr:hypothetical protein [Methylobacterium sp. SyP6R]MCF4127550.1 hypothetical protein [Methylobacterium sp. SyP6R]